MSKTDESPEGRELVTLISARREKLKLSLKEVEVRTVDPKTGRPLILSTWLHRLEAGTLAHTPKKGQLWALADALELHRSVVADAAAKQYFDMEHVYSEDGEVRVTVARIKDMSPDELSRLQQLMDIAFPQVAK